MATHNLSVTCNGGTTTCPNLTVRDPKNDNVKINWNAPSGMSFPASGAFTWKPGKAGPSQPVLSNNNTRMTLDYNMPLTNVTWSYFIKLNDCNQSVDPDINNDPPGDDRDVVELPSENNP